MRTLILLPKDFRKFNGSLDCLLPSSSFKSKAHWCASFANRGQLKEITSNDNLSVRVSPTATSAWTYMYLNASEGFNELPPDYTTDLIQLIEKSTVDHRD